MEIYFKNATRPELLRQRKFSYVIGNPPWLVYRNIESKTFQDIIRKLATKFSLIDKNNSNLYSQIELGTIFFAFCKEHFLDIKGTLAFVMPRSIITGAKQHKLFQKEYIKKSFLLFDFKELFPLFRIPSCVLFSKKTSSINEKIPLIEYSGSLPSTNLTKIEADKYITKSVRSYKALKEQKPSFYHEFSIQGATLVPRPFWFIQTPEKVKILDINKPIIETNNKLRNPSKAPWLGVHLLGAVESDFIYSTILTENLLPFGFREKTLLVLPIKVLQSDSINGSGLKKSIIYNRQDALSNGLPGLADWLGKVEKVYEEKSKKGRSISNPYQRLNYGKSLSKQINNKKYIVIYNRSGSHVAACLIEQVDCSDKAIIDNIPVMGFIVDSTLHYISTTNRDEGNYLVAYLNSQFVDKTIKPYQTKGSFGAKAGKGERDIYRLPFEVINWPKFDSTNVKHLELAELGNKSTQIVEEWVNDNSLSKGSAKIGTLRSQIRNNVIADILDQIDKAVVDIVNDNRDVKEHNPSFDF